MRPTRKELETARNTSVPDVIAPGLAVLFCGINPGLYTAAVGHHFARPGNRFWTTLYRSGFTPRLFSPYEDGALLLLGLGITNLVNRATATAAEISPAEYRAGALLLEKKVAAISPAWLAFVGIGAYRIGFRRPKAMVGPQAETVGKTKIWVLPNPSGLNQNHRLEDLIRLYGELRRSL